MLRLLARIRYRAKQRREWRRQLRSSPALSRCWEKVRRLPTTEPGFREATAKLCTPNELIEERAHYQPWYPEVQADIDNGANKVARFQLSYAVKGVPQDTYVTTHYVSTLDSRLLGSTKHTLKGY